MKKILTKKKVILIAAFIMILMIVGVITAKVVSARYEDERNVYLALRYLEDSRTEFAKGYLLKVSDRAGKRIGFARDSAEIIKEQMVGNTTLGIIKIDMMQKKYSLNESKAVIANFLLNGRTETQGYDEVIELIKKEMKISKKRKETYDNIYLIELSSMSNGYLSDEQRSEYTSLCGKEAAKSLEMSAALSNGNYSQAIQQAVELTQDKASAQNRLLLASVIADATYAGYPVSTQIFYNALEKEAPADEYSEKEKKIEELNDKKQVLILQLTDDKKAEETQEVYDKIADVDKEIEKTQKEITADAAYRAMNSIADIHSVEADIIKAKLWFSVGEEEKAIDILVDAASSWKKIFCDNTAIDTGLKLVDTVYNDENISSAKSSGTAEVIVDMLNAPAGIVVMDNAYNTYIADAMANELFADFKYMDGNIYISNFDASAFPDISMDVYGQENIIDDIKKKKNIVIKDTHKEVDYTVEEDETESVSICFVVDVSGSMSGQPILNAVDALNKFAETMDENIEIALVEFDDSSKTVVPLTYDKQEFLSGVASLYADGGTSLTEGINRGIEALKNAANSKNIIMMTDGQSSLDYSCLDAAKEEGITIFTVGFGEGVETEMLEEIAETTGGTFTLADASNELDSVYQSIGALLSNRIRIHYTVSENPDENSRYVFVRDTEYAVSDKYSYRLDDVSNSTYADDFYIKSGVMIDLEDLEYTLSWQNSYNVSFDVSDYTVVDSAEINGKTWTFDEDSYYIGIDIDEVWLPGVYPITFHLKDGSDYTTDSSFLIYDSKDERVREIYNSHIHVGDVEIVVMDGVIMSDGSIYSLDTRINDLQEQQENVTLYAYSNNLVHISADSIASIFADGYRMDGIGLDEDIWEHGMIDYYDGGDSASFSLQGIIMLGSSDAQNIFGLESKCAVGALTGIINESRCTINVNR